MKPSRTSFHVIYCSTLIKYNLKANLFSSQQLTNIFENFWEMVDIKDTGLSLDLRDLTVVLLHICYSRVETLYSVHSEQTGFAAVNNLKYISLATTSWPGDTALFPLWKDTVKWGGFVRIHLGNQMSLRSKSSVHCIPSLLILWQIQTSTKGVRVLPLSRWIYIMSTKYGTITCFAKLTHSH
jgi:hypothetical protein